TPATAVMGDVVSAVVQFNSTTGNVQITTTGIYQSLGFPYCNLFTGSWNKQNQTPVFVIEYSDGSRYDTLMQPMSGDNTATYNSGSTPDERALRFRLKFPATLAGAWVRMTPGGTSAAFDVVLYDGESGATLGTMSWDANNWRNTGGF